MTPVGVAAVVPVWVQGGVLVAPAQCAVPLPPRLSAERLRLPSLSGDLAAWALPADPARGAGVPLHGVRADRSPQAERMRLFHEAGYGVLAFLTRTLPAAGRMAEEVR